MNTARTDHTCPTVKGPPARGIDSISFLRSGALELGDGIRSSR